MKEFGITAREVSIETHGLSFLCAFGTHINGGWCAILNCGVCCELSNFKYDTSSNTDAIACALKNSSCANRFLPDDEDTIRAIAAEISEFITDNISGG